MWITVDKFCEKLTKERLFVDKWLVFMNKLHKKVEKRQSFIKFLKVIHPKRIKRSFENRGFYEVIHRKMGFFG